MKAPYRIFLLFIFQLTVSHASDALDSAINAIYISQNPDGDNQIAAYIQDSNSGKITLLNQYKTGGKGLTAVHGNSSHALVTQGKFLFCVNSGDNSITSFEILSGGALRLIGRYPSGGTIPVSLAVHGDVLYALNQGVAGKTEEGQLSAFTIAADGSLVAITTAHIDLPAKNLPVEVLVTPKSGLIGVSLHDGDEIQIFKWRDNTIVEAASEQIHLPPYGGATLSPSATKDRFISLGDSFLFTLDDEKKPGVLSIQSSVDGSRNRIHRNTHRRLKDPCWGAISPDGKTFWISSFATRILSLYSLGLNGSLAWLSDTDPIKNGPGGLDITTDPNGKYLFRLRAFDTAAPYPITAPYIDVFVSTGTNKNAGLSLIETIPLPPEWNQSAPMGIVSVRTANLESAHVIPPSASMP
jgi:6-phosphogluconolactonase